MGTALRSDELYGVQSHPFDLVAVLRVAPLESHCTGFKTDQAAIGDGHSVRVSGKVLEDMFGAAKQRLRIYDQLQIARKTEPVLEPQGCPSSLRDPWNCSWPC